MPDEKETEEEFERSQEEARFHRPRVNTVGLFRKDADEPITMVVLEYLEQENPSLVLRAAR